MAVAKQSSALRCFSSQEEGQQMPAPSHKVSSPKSVPPLVVNKTQAGTYKCH